MAYLKGVDLSGSSDISGSIGIFGQVTGSSFTGSFTGSFTATELSATDLTVSGTASIGYLETIYETASIIYSSGSTKFGDTLDDTHQYTGSVSITGSLTSDLIGTASFAETASYVSGSSVDGLVESASLALTASYVTASNVDGLPEGFPYTGAAEITGSLTVTGSIYSDSQIYATASYAISASYISGSNVDGLVESASLALTASYITASNVDGLPDGFPYTGSAIISGSLIVTGSIYSDSTIFATASHSLTASYASGSSIDGLVDSASLALTASYITGSSVDGLVESASLALTASYITASNVDGLPDGFPYTGSAIISGSLTVTGSIYSDSQIYATASYALTASYASGSSIDGLVDSASLALTASYVSGSSVDGLVASASYALNGGVTSIIAGSGIVIDQSIGNITISTDTIPGGSVASSSFTNATAASLIHNFGSTNVIVAVYNENGDEIIPSSISLLNDNTVNVSFSSPESGDIVAIEAQTGEFATASFSSTSSVTLNHSLGTQNLNVVAYNDSNIQFIPDIEVLDSSNVKATFAAPTSGRLLAVARDGSVSASFSNIVDETITHNLSGSAIFVTVYDTSYNEIIPNSISIVDDNNINLTFAATSSGNVVIAGGAIDATSAEIATTYNQAITGSSSYTVIHNLNAEWPLVQVYDSASRAQVRDYTITSIDASRISATFTSSFNGFIIINS